MTTTSKDVTLELGTPSPNRAIPSRSLPSTGLLVFLFVIPLAFGVAGVGVAISALSKVDALEKKLDSKVDALEKQDALDKQLGSQAAMQLVMSSSSKSPAGYGAANGGITSSLLSGSGEWAPGTDMPSELSDFQTVYCVGKIVLLGGMSKSSVVMSEVRTFDPINEVYSEAKAPMPTPRARFGAVCLEGQVYVAGGFENSTAGEAGWSLTTVDVYDVANDLWSAGPPLSVARGDLALATVGGKVYAIGGYDWSYSPVATNEVLDPLTGRWSTAKPMINPKGDIQAVTINNKVYVPGGWNVESTFLSELAVYDPTLDSWSLLAPMLAPRGDKAVVALNGHVFAIGGERWSGTTSLCDWGWGPEECQVNLIPMHGVEMYSVEDDAWTSVAPLPASRFRFAAAAVDGTAAEGSICAFGGHEHGEVAVNTMWTYHTIFQQNVYFHTKGA